MSKSDNVPVMYQSIPAGFDPMKLLRKAVSSVTGEAVLRLEMPYKKLWFRKAYPNGRIRVKPLRLTEQIAIYEAQVFLNRDDNVPICSFTSSVKKDDVPNGQYAEKAQYDAVDNALADAGFGIQIADRYYGSEIPVSAFHGVVPKTAHNPVSKAVKTVVQVPAAPEQTVPASQVKTVETTVRTAAATAPKAETVTEPKAETPAAETPVMKAEPAIQQAEQRAVQEQPVQTVTVPVAEETARQVPHAANAALELLRGGAAATPAPAAKADDSDLPFTIGPAYNNEMSVEQIVQVMTVEQAKEIVVDEGLSKGMKMGEVAESRPASLKFYLSPGYRKNNNVLRAAAQILNDLRQKAS